MTPHQLATALEPAFQIPSPGHLAIGIGSTVFTIAFVLLGILLSKRPKVRGLSRVFLAGCTFGFLCGGLFGSGAYEWTLAASRYQATRLARLLQTPGVQVRTGWSDARGQVVEVVVADPVQQDERSADKPIAQGITLEPLVAIRADSILRTLGDLRFTHARAELFPPTPESR